MPLLASVELEALFGIHIPPSQAVAVAQACLPSGLSSGDRQRVLMPDACVEGLPLRVLFPEGADA